MSKACFTVGLPPRTLQRWNQPENQKDQRRGPKTRAPHALTAAEKDQAVQIATSPAYRNLSPERIVAKLADEGRYVCSERSFRRTLDERDLSTYRERSKPSTTVHKPRQYVANGPLQVLSWDITYLRQAHVRGGFFYLYMFEDIWSRRIVGFDVHAEQSDVHSSVLLREVCQKEAISKCVVHSDNGGPMKGSTMLATLHGLGLSASFSRPGVSDDNPFIEALFRHLKYAPSYPSSGFDDLQHARQWVSNFVQWYNEVHLHGAIGLVTPHDRHSGRDITILAQRRGVYEQARTIHPRRWTGKPRSWHRPAIVTLNPDRIVLISARNSHAA